jgi:hypothetical protein
MVKGHAMPWVMRIMVNDIGVGHKSRDGDFIAQVPDLVEKGL